MEKCQTSNCTSSPIAICLHCQEQLCVDHLLQHNEQLLRQANVYCDEFNELSERIESLSFEQEFASAEEELHDWINEQMKQLDRIYEEKLLELKQARSDVDDKLNNFQQCQRMKLADIQRRLFTPQLNKQISMEQLNRMKAAVEHLREDVQQFTTRQCAAAAAAVLNIDRRNCSYQSSLETQSEKNISKEEKVPIDLKPDSANVKKSQLSAHAKPFEYIPKDPVDPVPVPVRHDHFSSRLFNRCAFIASINQTT